MQIQPNGGAGAAESVLKKGKEKKKLTILLGLGSEEPRAPGRTCRHGYR